MFFLYVHTEASDNVSGECVPITVILPMQIIPILKPVTFVEVSNA